MMKKLLVYIILANASQSLFANSGSDSLLKIYRDVTVADSTRIDALHAYAYDVQLRTQPDSAYYYAKEEFEFAKKIGDRFRMANALNTQGVALKNLGQYDFAIDKLEESLALKEQLGFELDQAVSLNNLGLVYEKKGDYVKAVDYYERSLKLKEKAGEPKYIASALLNLGSAFFNQKELETALKYYRQSQQISIDLGDEYSIAMSYIYIGNIHGEKGEYDKALAQFTKSLEMSKKMGNKQFVAGLTHNIGLVYAEQGLVDEAYPYFEESYALRKEMGSLPGMAQSLTDMATYHKTKGDLLKATRFGEEALDLAQQMGDIELTGAAAEELYGSYKNLGNYEKALEMFELSEKLQDSMLSETNLSAMLQQKFRYNYEKQKALDDLENQKVLEIEQQKSESQQSLLWTAGAALLLISILSFFIFQRLRITRKQRDLIAEQKIQVEQSERYKDQFLANMSHEIRTPMHAIAGMVKILARNEHLPHQQPYLDAMRISADSLLVILNDVLDLSKIEAGKLEIEHIPVKLSDIQENLYHILRFKAEEKGLQLEINTDNDLPEWIMSDPTRLNQILINLVGNAIKFSEKGSVQLNIKQSNNKLLFTIKDIGIGIAKNKQSQIFLAFEQAEGSTTRRYGGTGLGLSISQKLTKLLGGRIWFESEEGKGTEFFVELPIEQANEELLANEKFSDEELIRLGEQIKGINVLLVEDNLFNQMIALDDLNYFIKELKIDTALNGLEALEKFKTNKFDVVLMDVQMPEMNGIEATQAIRKWEKENEKEPTPIIAMTASVSKTEIEQSIKAGMKLSVPKPYQMHELIGTLHGVLKQD